MASTMTTAGTRIGCGGHLGGEWRRSARRTRSRKRGSVGVSALGGVELGEKFLVEEFGWRVRRMTKVSEEVREVARIQAEAFHEPSALFDDFLFQFFEADVLQALIYRMKNSPPDRYACLVAEPRDSSNPESTSPQCLVGVVDVSIQRELDVLKHLEEVEEYLYVSGIAVLKSWRRRRVASALLRACDAQSIIWGCTHMVLHAYEDDKSAQELYKKAGYEVVSDDPWWVNPWLGKRRRVLMIKKSSLCKFLWILFRQIIM
ncbi:acyl-CoA N-acyltransferases (NAT) superfamily protein isoform X2 [Wolffia australiana]